MIKTVVSTLLLAGLLAALPAQAQSGKTRSIQCWTEASGQRACGDRVPPEYASQERQVFDKAGRVVQTKPREKTPEELAEEARLKREAAEQKALAEKAAAYDRFLLDSYSGVKDLERARNDRLLTLDGRVGLTHQAVAGDEKSLVGLKAREEAALKARKPVSPTLKKQLTDVQRNLRENRSAIEQFGKDREKVCADFERDIKRYQELSMGSATYVASCPAPGTLKVELPVVKKSAKKKPASKKPPVKKPPPKPAPAE